MAGITTRSLSGNSILNGIEGTRTWNPGTTLNYAFATNADQADVTGYLNSVSATGAFNALDTETNYRNAVLNAYAAYRRVANINFTNASSYNNADLKISGADNYAVAGGTTGGSADFPGSITQGTSGTNFESYLILSTTTAAYQLAAEQGGATTLSAAVLHESGHSLGLAHPHDSRNGSTTITGLGLTDANDIPLDNQRYTVMSYEWGGLNVKTGFNYGHAVSPSALDIAAIQRMYGANTNTNTGDTTYTLVDRGAGALDTDGTDSTVQIGRAFFSIWDNGGTDRITYNGSRRVVLNLNDATLSTTDDALTQEWIGQVKQAKNYSQLPSEFQNDIESSNYHAGGFFSRIFQNATPSGYDLGGYSIANGVEIENASSAGGNDFLIGNEQNNLLQSSAGDDFLHGSTGNDTLQGGNGADELVGGRGNDSLDGGAQNDVAIFSGSCSEYDITRSSTGEITVVHARGTKNDGTDTLTNIEQARFKDAKLDLTAANIKCVTDFVFLVDLSGSFSDDLANFVASARSIANSVRAESPDAQFAVASFVDRPVDPFGAPGDYLYSADLPLTDSIADFEAALASLSVLNGGDTPESQYVGLWRAANGIGLNLRENSQKVILVATDASPHSAADYGLDESTIRNFLENEGITVNPAIASTRSNSSTPIVQGATLQALDNPEQPPLDQPEPDLPGPDATGNGEVPPLPDDGLELLLSELNQTLNTNAATPIFAVTADARSTYEEAEAALGRGATVTLDSNSENIADAVRQALAEISGEVTDPGTDGDDTLIGTPDPDTLFGGNGNDRLEGLDGDDVLDGGADFDTVLGGTGNDLVTGGTSDDVLDAGEGSDILEPGAGTDTLTLGTGDDIIRGTASELNGDTIQDFSGDVIVVFGSVFSDFTVTSDGTNSTLSFGSGADQTNIILAGNFTQDDFTATPDPSAPTENTIISTGSTPNPRIVGTPDADTLDGTAGVDTIIGRAGDDQLNGLEGNDILRGNAGNDLIVGGEGDDILVGGGGFDSLQGDAGKDTFLFHSFSQQSDGLRPALGHRILDFNSTDDQIVLRKSGFSEELAIGRLRLSQFVIGAAAADKNDRIIYNAKTGNILFDADGTGTAKAVVFAVVDPNLGLSNTDFRIA
jgi:Ca2+-binding RTX toxin-like protein